MNLALYRAARRRARASWSVAIVAAVAGLALAWAPAAALGAGESERGPVPAAVAGLLGEDPPAVVPYAELVEAARAGGLNAAVVDTSSYWVAAVDRDGRAIAARIPRPEAGRDFAPSGERAARPGGALPGAFDLADALRESHVAVLQPPASGEGAAGSGLSPAMRYLLLPLGFGLMALFIVGGMLLIRGRGSGGRGLGGRGGAQGHGKIRKNAVVPPPASRFGDVAGCDEAVEELREVVEFLQDPGRFAAVGARMPRGVVLHGPPGTGKTLLAKAVAGEAGVPFFALSGSDFVDTYVGVGASRVRDLFAQARRSERGAIIFFDELDAVGRARGQGGSGADSEREGTLNQLLVELDGFGARDRIVVIAATNRLDMLDAALLRPGRFDRRVQVGLPAEAGRLAILRLHSRRIPIAEPAALEGLARVTAGFAGADLANIVNEAAIMAARGGRGTVLASDLDEGLLRAVAGPQRADRRMADGELETIAWHEAGHALAAELCPTHQTAQRVTILARGDAGGLALYGSMDRALTSQQQLHERMVVAMAGRAAEQLRFGLISSGAANDLEQVNAMAREAVERLGFSPRLGQIVSSAGARQAPLSGETRRVIDDEIGRMVDAAYADAVALLAEHREELDRLAIALLERETLDRAQLEALLAGVGTLGRRRPARADALPVPREVAIPAPAPAPLPVLPAPAPLAAAPEPRPAPPPLPAPARARRGRRIRAGAEAAAATVYALTLPRLRARGTRRRRVRPKPPRLA